MNTPPTTNYDNIDFNKWQSAKQWRWKNRNSSGRVYSTLQINWTLIPSSAGTELMSIKSSRNTKSFRFKLFKSWRSLGEKSCQFWNVCNNVFVQSLSKIFFFFSFCLGFLDNGEVFSCPRFRVGLGREIYLLRHTVDSVFGEFSRGAFRGHLNTKTKAKRFFSLWVSKDDLIK